MNISAQDVNRLRKETNAGFMDCKNALVEAGGDFEKAIDILRKKGQKISLKRADRETAEGFVVAKSISDNQKDRSVIFALTCETDFVAKNDIFQKLANDIADSAIKNNIETTDELLKSKINGVEIQEEITQTVGKIGEKIEIKSLHTSSSSLCTTYIHPGDQLGVLLCMENITNKTSELKEAAYNIAMQIAAMNPLALSEKEIPQETLDKEMEIAIEQAKKEGKPENITEKIAQGKVNKFMKENTLINQLYIKDNSMTISKYLESIDSNAEITKFYRVSIK